MPNKIQRGSAQNHSLVIRVTEEDKVHLRMAADREGLSVSGLVKTLLMQEKIIQPTYLKDEV